MNTGDRIKQLRMQKNMTLEELGQKVGVGKSTVRKWETGAIANMRRDKIAKLAEALDTTVEDIIGLSSPDDDGKREETIPQVTMIGRAMEKSSPEKREQMLQLLKIAFPEEFE